MEKDYETKDLKAGITKMKEPQKSGMGKPEHMEDGSIFERDGLFIFKWKGGECGFASQEAAEDGLARVSGVSS